jgi:hypothetical protein
LLDLLTGRGGYGFPRQNVCLLTDADATVAGFARAFDEVLVNRARPGDVAVLYFAGHGSYQRDENGDEPDEKDETLLLHDSRTGGVGDLVDDEFNAMIARLSEKTKNVVVILDSCHSGTATRGPAGTLVSRLVPPARTPARVTAAGGDGAALWSPTEMPGLVVLAAASEATSAYEVDGAGVFTDALLRVLSEVQSRPLLYAQVARLVPSLVAARSYQIPYFHGELDRPVFGNTTRSRPVGWEVVEIAPSIKLSGPPLPGFGKDAELRVYAGNAAPGETQDPARAKATIVVERASGVNAWAHVLSRPQDAPPLAIGDLAVLARVADEYLRLKARLRPASEPGGLPPPRPRRSGRRSVGTPKRPSSSRPRATPATSSWPCRATRSSCAARRTASAIPTRREPIRIGSPRTCGVTPGSEPSSSSGGRPVPTSGTTRR